MVAIDVIKDDLETLSVKVALTGLTAGTRYDVFRLQVRYLGKDDADARIYERELPDRRGLWSVVSHRMGWEASAASHTFRDYECPKRPTQYYVCASSAGGPSTWRSPGAWTPATASGSRAWATPATPAGRAATWSSPSG